MYNYISKTVLARLALSHVVNTPHILQTNTLRIYLGAKATVSKAIRLGKRSAKPRLLIVTVDSVEAKAFILILRSCTDLRKADPASHYHKIYVTPDLTPAQREANLQLRTKLKEMNKDGKSYVIKNGRIVQRRNQTSPRALIIL